MNINQQQFIIDTLKQPPIFDQTINNVYATTEKGEKIALNLQRDIANLNIDPYDEICIDILNFIKGNEIKKWILLSGLRGLGKTTLLKQLYYHPQLEKNTKFYLSLDNIQTAQGQILDIIIALEEALDTRLENYKQPVILLLDEIQYLDNWSVGLKTIFDRLPRVLIISAGSSALSLQINPDIARRSKRIKMHPLSWRNYTKIKQLPDKNTNIIDKEMSLKLQQIIFQSSSGQQVYNGLKTLMADLDYYWSKFDSEKELNNYINYGSLPYTLNMLTLSEIYKTINQSIDAIILKDICSFSNFDSGTIASFPKLLSLLNYAEQRSLGGLSQKLDLNIKTTKTMLYYLNQTDLIQEIKPHGSQLGHLTKPYRYLFSSPAIRQALNNSSGLVRDNHSYQGRIQGLLLEDLIFMHLRHMRQFGNDIIEYLNNEGEADFIISSPQKTKSIVIEVGQTKKTSRQVQKTLSKITSDYGLIISRYVDLKYNPDTQTVYIPLKYFLLVI